MLIKFMFEYFTEKAIKAIILAQEEARRSGHNLVGTEHLLLGLIGEETSVAAVSLQARDVRVENTRDIIKNLVGKGSGFSPANIPFTPKVKIIFEKSFPEAQKLGHNYIAPEHILLAVIQDKEAVATKALVKLGVDLNELRLELIKKSGETVPVAVGVKDREKSQFERNQASLKDFSQNLTELAAAGKIDPVIGREAEINRTIQILGRRTKNNPVLVGEPGVGKTAIAEGLAQKIVAGEVPESLLEKQVISLDLGLLLAGTRFRGEFEERLQGIIAEVRENPQIILVIDEIHTLVGAGAMGGTMDAANMLKPALARGELQCIGTTTLAEYRQYIESDGALERRLQKVMVNESSLGDTLAILQGLRHTYEEFHQVKYSDKAITAAAKLAERYISDRYLPDKAIDLIDEAGSRTHIRHSLQGKQTNQELPETRVINPQSLIPVVDETEIASILSAWTGIPVQKMTESEAELLLNLEARLQERVIGQTEAVKAVAKAIRRSRVGLKSRNRPIASLFFSGPTGVGKTELSKAIANILFGNPEAMIRLDMSEYMERHTVSKLIGSPPGYVGYEEGGKLTEAVRRQPYSVILLDEIEKAHPDVFNLMLQLLDDGRLTDAQGRQVDFSNTLVIMTSNIGSQIIEKGGTGLGFQSVSNSAETEYKQICNLVQQELKEYFRPEFLNRLDEIIVFRPLTNSQVREIADLLLQDIGDRLQAQQQITLQVTDAFKNLVVAEGYQPSYGARPLRRTLTRLLEDSLAEAILARKINSGDAVLVDLDAQQRVRVAAIKSNSQVLVG